MSRNFLRNLSGVPVAALAIALTLGPAGVANAASDGQHLHTQITASGSSWAANAVNQWVADVVKQNMQVVFTSSGSAQGRRDFANKTSDFAISDIGFQGQDPETGASDTSCSDPSNKASCVDYAYIPIVAGGTSFPYQIRVGGQLVQNLRLTGKTLTEIFTNTLGLLPNGKPGPYFMNWDDPEITAENNGRKLPSLPIIPVVHSEGSGSTAQFTRYMDTEYPSLWVPFNEHKNTYTEYFPRQGQQKAQNGSDGVINFITSAAANGAIGYDEFSYALGKSYPVVDLENKAGYYVPPTQYNVAVALTKAQINYDRSSPDYLLQNLNDVYVNADSRAYPISSYSYGIIPTGPNSNDSLLSTPVRQTMADFLYYSICQGQSEMGPIGYSPLPINLVQAGFQQIALFHKDDSGVQLTNENVSTCHNPTFIPGKPKENYLAKVAPQPIACEKSGAGPCATYDPTSNANPTKSGSVPTGSGGNPSSSGAGNSNSSGSNPSGSNPSGTTSGASPGATVPGAGTGVPGAGGSSSVGTGAGTAPLVAGSGSALIGNPTDVAAASNGGISGVLTFLAILELLVIIALPPFITHRMRQRKASG
jgi:ABC-type phosphate transport system substrate-binding protein